VLEADRLVLDQPVAERRMYTRQLKEPDRRLAAFAQTAPAKEAEAQAIPNRWFTAVFSGMPTVYA